jgi:hypothetical protein
MICRSVALVAAIAALLSGCASDSQYQPAAGQKMHLTQSTYAAFQEYQKVIGSSHPGAFAVSQSGRYSFYFYCEDVVCISGKPYGPEAVKRCEGLGGSPCYVFAYGNDVKVDYEVTP